ncbi:MAG TPA: hypothetical protein VLG11_00385 [Candidatus Saccharimonadales bacterium]|nr:hypothetical protein [Candidatus Saccharimonadales bacterium]
MLRYQSITLAEKTADRHGRDTLISLTDPYDSRLVRAKALHSMGFPITIELMSRAADQIPMAASLGRIAFYEEEGFCDCLFGLDVRQSRAAERLGGWERRMYWHPASMLEPIHEGRPEAIIGYARNLEDAHLPFDKPLVAGAFMTAVRRLQGDMLPNVLTQYNDMLAHRVRPIGPNELFAVAVDYYQRVADEWPPFAAYRQLGSGQAEPTL